MHFEGFTDYSSVQEYLFSLKAKGPKFGIDRMSAWSEALGHPESAVPCIHITGTNGKGSTGAMIESIFRTAGWRTGLYTSPHLVRLGERVQVDRVMLTPDEIVAFTNQLRPIAAAVEKTSPDEHPSFFEFMTAMAFLQFKRKACDISIIEVGLGGRLDATNVVMPEVSVVTSISLDHCEMLGNTVEEIAREKAGIIKSGRPVIVGHVPAEAKRVIREVAEACGAPISTIGEAFGDALEGFPRTNLAGDHQRWNAATAALVARSMPPVWKLTESIIELGLNDVKWPGRWERVSLGGRPIILDASHNPEGAAVLEVSLRQLAQSTENGLVIIVGVLGAARATPLIQTISRYAREIYLVVPDQARACSHEELRKMIPPSFSGKVHSTNLSVLFPQPHRCTAGNENDIIVVTGSIYLLGEVLARIEPERGAGEGRLQDF